MSTFSLLLPSMLDLLLLHLKHIRTAVILLQLLLRPGHCHKSLLRHFHLDRTSVFLSLAYPLL